VFPAVFRLHDSPFAADGAFAYQVDPVVLGWFGDVWVVGLTVGPRHAIDDTDVGPGVM
jgi:hypothetical protein